MTKYKNAKVISSEFVSKALLEPILNQAIAADRGEDNIDSNLFSLRDAGLLNVLQSKELGGKESSLVEGIGIVRDLSTCCGSTGWNSALFMSHAWMMSFWPKDLQEILTRNNSRPLLSTAILAGQNLRIKDLGNQRFQINGHWRTISGIRQADWLAVTMQKPNNTGRGQSRAWVLLPVNELEIIEGSWDMLGLRATQSLDVKASGLIIDSLNIVDFLIPPNEHTSKASSAPVMSLAMPEIVSALGAAVATGLARRVIFLLQERLEHLKTNEAPSTYNALIYHLANAAIELDACEKLLRVTVLELEDSCKDKSSKARHVARSQGVAAWIIHHCQELTAKSTNFMGSGNMNSASHFQICLRDLSILTTHFYVNQSLCYQNYVFKGMS